MISVSEVKTTVRVDRDFQAIQSEHRTLGALAERLDALLGVLAARGRCEDADVGAMLDEFRRRLLFHLESEEERGVLERAAAYEPRLSRRVEQLRLEHDALRRDVALLAAGPTSGAGTADWTGFYARFIAFRDVLHDHEQAENDVLHSAYREDLGGG